MARLASGLLEREGIESVHVVPADGEVPARVCIHYLPDVIGLRRIRELTAALGTRLTDEIGHLALESQGIDRPARARAIEGRLRALDGVLEAHVAPTGAVDVEFDRKNTTETAILAVLRESRVTPRQASAHPLAGPTAPVMDTHSRHDHGDHEHDETGQHDHEPHDHGASGHDHAHGGFLGPRSELIFAILCAVTLVTGWALNTFTSVDGTVPTMLFVAAYFFGGWYTAKEAFETVRAGRFEIDFLMLIAAAGAALLGELAEGALLLALFSIGHALESYAMGRARSAIEALAELAPETALTRRDGAESPVPVGQLLIGDLVIVKPHERIPADGYVVLGSSSVDQSSVTGESVPVDKQPVPDLDLAARRPDDVSPENRVFAGTVNGSGAMEIRVSRLASESTLAKVVQMVTEAQTQTSPTQRFTDRFQRIFVPAVLTLVVVLLFAWVPLDETFSDSFYRALAVLVAASPCALAISTPSAVLSALARAARSGILIKGGGPLEHLGSLSAIAFDKTGTLTRGKPVLTDAVTAPGVEIDDLLSTAVAIETLSAHPLASAVITGAQERRAPDTEVPVASNVSSIIGRGISGSVDGDLVHVGKPILFSEIAGVPMPAEVASAVDSLEEAGRTTMVVRRGDRYLGVLGVMDTPRESAAPVLARLREVGIRHLVMISGDNQRVADAVARNVGIDSARGDLLPEDKVATIRELRAAYHQVAMVGDGVNDAPAMANATVGIAMGAAGSAVAMETADVALMADDLTRLPFAVELSRSASSIIKQNLWVSLGIVAILIPATIFGFLGIGAAVIVHEGSTLLVVANALRLLAVREKEWQVSPPIRTPTTDPVGVQA